MTLTFTQTVDDNDLYLYPNADNCACNDTANWDEEPTTPFGNYKYTLIDDDKDNPDEDTSYLYIDNEVEDCILFDLPNHTTETGTINYVQIYARAKTHQYAMADTGEYKIIISPNATCTDYHESRNFELVTSYKNYTEIWTENPESSATWTWNDIDNLAIGIYIDNDSIFENKNLTLRPNAVGTYSQNTAEGDTDNYKCVDEEDSDGDSTYVWQSGGGGYKDDSYNVPNHTTESGSINYITIFTRSKTDIYYGGFNWKLYLGVYIGGTGYYSNVFDVTTSYESYSYTWNGNPNSGGDWTWNDVDNLEIGFKQQSGDASVEIRTTQNYAVVNYSETTIPEVRTTQIYARVNYSETYECALNKPISFSSNHSRNVKKLNFWNAQREVYDLSRSNKTLVLEGSEIYSGACDRIQCIRDMGLRGETVTISGFNPACFDGDYKIRSFGWKEVSKKPARFDWVLELESED